MELPVDFFVKPIEDHPDLFAFTFDFVPEGKALEDGTVAPVVTELDDGDLIIEGYAAVFEGVDRQGENFIPGAFQRGLKSFLNGSATLAYCHKRERALGKVLDLREEPDKGLWMRARVDGAIRSHPELKTYYEQIKKGTLNALSVGGFFKRKLTENGFRISDVDFTEISVAPISIHPGTQFSVVAGKALLDDVEIPEKPEIEGEIREDDVRSINFLLEELKGLFDRVDQAAARRKPAES